MNRRIQEFQQTLRDSGAYIENPIDIKYLTGLSLSKGVFAVTKRESALFVDGRYLAAAKKTAPCVVRELEGEAPVQWFKELGIAKLVFDSASINYDSYLSLKKQAEAIELIPKSRLLKLQRGIKDAGEIEILKRAAELTWKGCRHALSCLKEGISEEEIAWEFETFVRKSGASKLSFEPIVAFGENSAYPHHRAGKTKLTRDQIVLIDVGAVVNDYRGDLTRVHFFGQVEEELMKMLSLTQKAQQAAIDSVKIGVKLGEVDQAAKAVFREAGVEALFTHGLGHGVGLEIHEFPSLKAIGGDGDLVIQQGMVFTIEPGLYKPGVGGVRWEDTILVGDHGAELLFQGT